MSNRLRYFRRSETYRDIAGIERRPAFYQAMPATMQAVATQLHPGRVHIDPPDWAKSKDAEIWRKILRDPVIFKAVQIRMHAVASAEWYFEAADRKSRALVPYFEAIFNRIPNFAQARLALASGIFEGRAWLKVYSAEKKFSVEDDDPRMWWYAGWLGHIGADAIRREFREEIITDENGARIPKREYYWSTLDPTLNGGTYLEVDRDQLPWYLKFSYRDDQHSLGYGNGILDAIYVYWKAKTHILENLFDGIGRFGTPWIWAAIDQASSLGNSLGNEHLDPEDKAQALLTVLGKMTAGKIIVTDAKDKIDLVHMDGVGLQAMREMLDYCDSALVSCILGSGKPFGEGDQGGSYALGAVQERTTDDLLRFDRDGAEEALQQLVDLTFQMNVSNFSKIQDGEGRFLHTLNPPRIRLRDVSKGRSPDMLAMALQLGAPVLKREVYETLNFTMPDAGDDVFNPPGAGGEVPGQGGPAQDLMGNPTLGPADTTPDDGLRMSEATAHAHRFFDLPTVWRRSRYRRRLRYPIQQSGAFCAVDDASSNGHGSNN